MILLIDNFDSFTYNIVQAYQQLGCEVHVVRNHVISCEAIVEMNPRLVVMGPGPGVPSNLPLDCARIVERGISVFGICLGHQAIGEAYGARIIRATRAVHGKVSPIFHLSSGVFEGLSQGFNAARYHSLVIDSHSIPEELEVTAWTEQGEVMGIRHRSHPIEGVQFHPESIASQEGMKILRNSLLLSKMDFLVENRTDSGDPRVRAG